MINKMLRGALNRKLKWKIKDLIDLEYFFLHDNHVDSEEVSRLNHSLYKEIINEQENNSLQRSDLIKLYLEKRKAKEKSGENDYFPGDVFAEGYRIFLIIIGVSAILSGLGLAFSLLEYNGVTPVNVSHFFGIIVVLQVAVVLLFFLLFLFRYLFRFRKRSLIESLFSSILSKVFTLVARHAPEHLSKEKRNIFAQISGKLKNWNTIYGSIIRFSIFTAVQTFGTAFNIGIIAATLIKVTVTDIAFGWQSTLTSSAFEVHKLVEAIAIPWSWIFPEQLAIPSIEQIEGSKMILKEGIKTLSNTDLSSWWPFLLLSVVAYGLFPRILLLVTSMLIKNRKLSKLDFNQVSCDRLIRQMKSPLVDTRGNTMLSNKDKNCYDTEVQNYYPHFTGQDETASVFIPAEIAVTCMKEDLQPYITNIFGFLVDEIITLDQDFESDIEHVNSKKEKNALIFIIEAWQPPINETIFFFQQIRKHIKKTQRIGIALIGKPGTGEVGEKVTHQEFQIWQNAICSIGDPYIRVEKLR